jgi:murein DD-endopeptidase MepM/ murein hydrolase activator NlpD
VGEQQAIPFQPHCGLWWGLVSFDALAEPGSYLLSLAAADSDGGTVDTTLPLTLRRGGYQTEAITLDAQTSTLLNPALIRAEHQRLTALIAGLPVGPPQWSGRFRRPLDTPITSDFGTRRSYNGGPADSYHEGIDYDGFGGEPVVAPAAGRVVLAETLAVRGNTIFLDHGAGVVSGYFHLSELAVQPGQVVKAGELLGKVGRTGLVTGPHLHWELRVNGVWVDPAPWLKRRVPF